LKTNAEWYLELPEPYRMQALNNAEKEDMLGMKSESLGAALYAFPWEGTPEGYDYWKVLFRKVEKGEFSEK